MATKDFRTRNEIVVTVNKQGDADDVQKRKRRGPIIPSKVRPGHLSRRLVNETIRLFDAGYKKVGDDFLPTTNPIIAPFDDTFFRATPIRNLTAADFDAMRSDVLGLGVENFKNGTFKEILRGENSDKYGLLANIGDATLPLDTLTEWTSNGFKLRQDQLDAGVTLFDTKDMFFPDALGNNVKLLDGVSGQKITSTGIYTDAAVPFVPAFEMKVYLLPDLAMTFGDSQYVIGTDLPPSTWTSFRAFLNYFWMILPRPWVITPSDPFYNNYTGTIGVVHAGSIPAYEAVIAKLASHNSLPGSRGRTYNLRTFGTAADFFSYTDPADPLITTKHTQQFLRCGFDTGLFEDGTARNGVLKAIVEKGDSFYYFWSDGHS